MASQLEGSVRKMVSADQATASNTPLDVLGLASPGQKIHSITLVSNANAASEYVFVYDAAAVPSSAYQNSEYLIGVFRVGASWTKSFPQNSPNGLTLANGLCIRVAASGDGSGATTASSTVDAIFEIEG